MTSRRTDVFLTLREKKQQNFPGNQKFKMIAQRDELVNEEQQQQQQQNGLGEEPAVISQENRLQNHPQNLRRTRMKWTKEMNIDIIRCYFNTILRIPNQPYRKEFYNRWVTLYPENRLTEQRICEQQRLIMRKATTNENTRGSWLTEMEITDVQATIANEIGGEINNEPVGQQAEVPNHQYQAEEHQQQHQIAEEKQHVPGQEINADQQLIEELLAKATVTPFSDRIIFNKPGRKSEFIGLKWLPIQERVKMSLAKLAWKSVHCEAWPKFLPMKKAEARRPARGVYKEGSLIDCPTNIRGTFEYDASKTFHGC